MRRCRCGSKRWTTTMAGSTATPRFRTALLVAFAGVALLLAVAGVYGVMAYTVNQRVPGDRLARGPRRVARGRIAARAAGRAPLLVVPRPRSAGRPFVASVHFISGLLFGVTATDPLVFAAVSILVALAALGACLRPVSSRARRRSPCRTSRGVRDRGDGRLITGLHGCHAGVDCGRFEPAWRPAHVTKQWAQPPGVPPQRRNDRAGGAVTARLPWRRQPRAPASNAPAERYDFDTVYNRFGTDSPSSTADPELRQGQHPGRHGHRRHGFPRRAVHHQGPEGAHAARKLGLSGHGRHDQGRCESIVAWNKRRYGVDIDPERWCSRPACTRRSSPALRPSRRAAARC